MRKQKLYRYITAILLMTLLVSWLSPRAIAVTSKLDIRGGEHDKYSRIVFDWSKQVNYKSKRSDGVVVDIVFAEKASSLDISKVDADSLKGLKAIKNINIPNKGTYIRLVLPKGARHRSYKLGNRVIFDLYHPKNATKAVPKKIVKKITKKLVAKPKVKPVKKTEPVVAKVTKILEPTPPAVVVEKVEQEKILSIKPKINTETKPEKIYGYTTITLSTIEPASLAVFERFGSLWMVFDTSFASITPLVAGSFAATLGLAESVDVKGGIAYRFDMPKQAKVVNVKFNNLSWIVTLEGVSGKQEKPMNIGYLRRVKRVKQKPWVELPFSGVAKVLRLHDSRVKDDIYVVASRRVGTNISLENRYPEFAILRAHQGAVIKPFIDDLSVKLKQGNIVINAPKGLIMTEDVVKLPVADKKGGIGHGNTDPTSRLFDFHSWFGGGLKDLRENQREIEAKIASAEKGDELSKVYLEMALLYFANGYGHEAIGALRAAAMERPSLVENPGFLAVKGGAEALAGFSHLAIKDLSTKGLLEHPEAQLWRAYAAASSEQWTLAGEIFPKSNQIVSSYPSHLFIPFTLYMAESALRLGDTAQARVLLDLLNKRRSEMKNEQKSALNYLQGEMHRQEDEVVLALKAWYPVVNGRDRLYYVKANLATIDLLRKNHRLSDEKAQDRLETLRYVWRGDGLEIQMLRSIAKLHLEKKEYIKGLEEMRKAVVLAEEILYDSSFLMQDMEKIFRELFVEGKADEMQPFEAISIYNSFKELMPTGYDSLIAEQNYVQYLIEMDLLDDAARIFERQLKHDLRDAKKIAETGAHLASVYLLDGKAQKALSALQRTGNKDLSEELLEKRNLLYARSLSEVGLDKQAIELLNKMSSIESKKLKATIYWKEHNWKQAASTLSKVLVSPKDAKKLSNAKESNLVLNTAVAYKLADDVEKLKEIRAKYLSAMKKTKHGSSFAVVTRQIDGEASLKDRQSVLKLAAEVDLFKSFLYDYKVSKRY